MPEGWINYLSLIELKMIYNSAPEKMWTWWSKYPAVAWALFLHHRICAHQTERKTERKKRRVYFYTCDQPRKRTQLNKTEMTAHSWHGPKDDDNNNNNTQPIETTELPQKQQQYHHQNNRYNQGRAEKIRAPPQPSGFIDPGPWVGD